MSFKCFIKNKFFLSFLAGSLCSLAFAPFNLFFTAAISLSVFYFLLDEVLSSDESEKRLKKNKISSSVVKISFCYGFGYFLAGNYWIAISLLVDAETFAWLIPFALTLIPSVLALYFVCFALSYKFLVKKFCLSEKYQKILAFSVCWLVFEILRSYLFNGFPWNLLGYIWMFDLRFAQLASIFGIYGLSFFAVLISLFPTLFFDKNQKFFIKRSLGDWFYASFAIIFFVGNFLFGSWRIDDRSLILDDKTKLRLVQANIEQEMKWDESEKYQNFLKTIELTKSKNLDEVKVVIWSETSVPYVIDDNQELLENLRKAVPSDGILITGALRVTYKDEIKTELADIWNSIFVINKSGVSDYYDKNHLVPFGEYVPLQKFLPFIEKITDGAVGFSRGEEHKTIATKDFSFSPLLCYEVIFTDETISKKSRPDLLINLTNDAWFGNSSGPYQHFNMARMRSIEYGISLARVANTGITAFIDPFGRIVAMIGLNQFGILDVSLIKSLAPTIYGKYGHQPLSLLVLAFLAFLKIIPQKKYDSEQNNTC